MEETDVHGFKRGFRLNFRHRFVKPKRFNRLNIHLFKQLPVIFSVMGGKKMRKPKIKVIPKKLPRGYVAMNASSAKKLKIPYPYSKNTIVVWKGLSKRERKRDIQHEIDEKKLIDEKGLSYSEAHRRATRLEKLGTKRAEPFTKKRRRR